MPLMHHEWAQETSGGVVLTVHAQPKATRTECAGRHGDALKIRLAAPPVEGAANDELVRFLAERIGIPQRAVLIQSGEGARRKRVLLRGVSLRTVTARLGQ